MKITVQDKLLRASQARLRAAVIQRQLMSEALNSAQMLEVCVLRHGGGGRPHSKGESSFFLLPTGGERCSLRLPEHHR